MPYHDIRDPEQLKALLDVVVTIESDLNLSEVLRKVVESAVHLTGARYGALGVLDRDQSGLSEFIHHGMSDDVVEKIGHLPEGAGILGLLILDPRPLRLTNLSAHEDAIGFPEGHPVMETFLGVPVRLGGDVFGNLYLTEKVGGTPFTEEDQAMVSSLASLAGVAINNARLYDRAGEIELLAERERLARELHDTVIQRLFASGLSLQSCLSSIDDERAHQRVNQVVQELDDTIRQIRTSIFSLESARESNVGVRSRVLQISNEAARFLGFEPEVRFAGVVELEVNDDLATDMLSTLREALANVARHARASRVEIEVIVGEDTRLLVTDNGVGYDTSSGSIGNGLRNMGQRARDRGGSLDIQSALKGGTKICWRIPLRG
ncbi:MAG: GAF domain-containing sensor histidine kinase [Acidimicrobiales bacterium]